MSSVQLGWGGLDCTIAFHGYFPPDITQNLSCCSGTENQETPQGPKQLGVAGHAVKAAGVQLESVTKARRN
jgi:hypothetical protein